MSKRKNLSDFHDKIIELSATDNLSEICRKLNLATSSLSTYLKQHNIVLPNKPRDVSEVIPAVKELASKGMNTKQIAEQLGFNPTSLRYQIKKLNIEVCNGKFLKENKEEETTVILILEWFHILAEMLTSSVKSCSQIQEICSCQERNNEHLTLWLITKPKK